MTQRHQLIIEQAKKNRVEGLINEPSELDQVRDVQKDRDTEFLKDGGVEKKKNFLQQSVDLRNQDIR